MPRASWNGFLRLSLVTCPVYLVPATTEAKRVRFNQLNADTGTRVAQQLVDSKTGDPVDRDQIVKGYEYERGRYVTITDDELKDLQIESSKIIDLDRFVERDEVDPIYLDTPTTSIPTARSRQRPSGLSVRRWRRRARSGSGMSPYRAGNGWCWSSRATVAW